MAGKALFLTSRDRQVLDYVRHFGVLTAIQCVRLGLFSSRTRVNERLLRLARAGWLKVRKLPLLAGGPRHAYLPGRLLIDGYGARRRLVESSDFLVDHQLGLVDIRISFERATSVAQWLSDRELAPLKLGVIPDAYIEYEHRELSYCAFIEYDRGTESLSHLAQKVRAYLNLAYSGVFELSFKRKFFRLLIITDSPARLDTISTTVAAVTDRVVRLTTLTDLATNGPAFVIWRRPGSKTLESLTS